MTADDGARAVSWPPRTARTSTCAFTMTWTTSSPRSRGRLSARGRRGGRRWRLGGSATRPARAGGPPVGHGGGGNRARGARWALLRGDAPSERPAPAGAAVEDADRRARRLAPPRLRSLPPSSHYKYACSQKRSRRSRRATSASSTRRPATSASSQAQREVAAELRRERDAAVERARDAEREVERLTDAAAEERRQRDAVEEALRGRAAAATARTAARAAAATATATCC